MGNLKELRARLATEKRTRKQKNLNRDELRRLWNGQLTETERESLRRLRQSGLQPSETEKRVTLGEAVQRAEEHLFDRNSVVLECEMNGTYGRIEVADRETRLSSWVKTSTVWP